MKHLNLLHRTLALFTICTILAFAPKTQTSTEPIVQNTHITNNSLETYHINIQYDPGLTETQKQAVRDCMTSTYGIQFIAHIPDFIAIGGDVELWLVQADISVFPKDKDGSGSNWGNGDGSEDGDQLPKGRICNALVTFSRID